MSHHNIARRGAIAVAVAALTFTAAACGTEVAENVGPASVKIPLYGSDGSRDGSLDHEGNEFEVDKGSSEPNYVPSGRPIPQRN